MFDLENRDSGAFPEPTKEELKAHRQKEYNKKQKTLMKVVGENLASYACLLIFVLLVGFIWTDIGIFVNITNFITDALVSVVLFILADICMAQVGTKGGRLDDDYIKVHNEYLKLREEVRNIGITLMDIFCDWQADVEYEFFIRKQCKELKLDYSEYTEKYQGKELAEICKLLPPDTAAKVFALNRVKRIELTPDMLMTDGKVKNERGGIPVSGEEYIERHTTSWHHILLTAVFAIVAAVPVFTLTNDVSIGRVIYTIFKLAMMCYRMYKGYSRGARGYNTVEPKHLQAKIKYLYLYKEFVNKKIYLKIADKYNYKNTMSENNDGKAQDATEIWESMNILGDTESCESMNIFGDTD